MKNTTKIFRRARRALIARDHWVLNISRWKLSKIWGKKPMEQQLIIEEPLCRNR